MAAITWRNVNGPDPASALRPLQAAQSSFNASADTLGNMITARIGENTKQENLGLEAQRNAFLDSLSGVRTPEELAAMQANGQLDQQMAGLDPRVRAQVRDAADTRMASLQQRMTQGQTFNDAQFDRQYSGMKDDYLTRIASATGVADLNTIRDELAVQQDIPNRAPMVQALNQRLGALQQAERSQASQKLTDMRTEAELAGLADTQKGKAALDAVLTRAQQHQQGIEQTAVQQGQQFDPSLPRTEGGILDMAKIRDDPALTTLYDQEAKRTGLTFASDTQAVLDAEQALTREGFSPRQALEAIAAGKGSFNSDPRAKITGLDKTRFEQNQQAIIDAAAATRENNSLFISNTNATEQLPALQKQLSEAGMDAESIRIISEEVVTKLTKGPKGEAPASLHIPSILAAARMSESWNPLAGSTFTKFRGSFLGKLEDIEKTEAYQEQMKTYLKSRDALPLRKEANTADSLRQALSRTPDRR